jgi:hypothetical protein
MYAKCYLRETAYDKHDVFNRFIGALPATCSSKARTADGHWSANFMNGHVLRQATEQVAARDEAVRHIPLSSAITFAEKGTVIRPR